MNGDGLLALVVSTNRLTEGVKRYLDRYTMDETWRRLLILLAQFAIAIVSVFLASTSVDILEGTVFGHLPPLLGIVTAGLAVGAGADFLHLIFDLTGRLGTPTASATISLPDNSMNSNPQASASVSVGTNSNPRG